MAAIHSTTERLSLRFPRIPVNCAIIGDSTIKYVHECFNPMEPGTPVFVSYRGATFGDILGLLRNLPPSLPRLVLHVGTVDIANNGCVQALADLKQLLQKIRLERPTMDIHLSLPLPRAPNRRRRGANKRFVQWFNREGSRFVDQVRRLCHRKELGHGVRYLDHAFHELPPWRVLAADGLHPSFEGVAMLALHFRRLVTSANRWHYRNRQPASNGTPPRFDSRVPAGYVNPMAAMSPRTPCPQAQSPTSAPPSPCTTGAQAPTTRVLAHPSPPQRAYNLRSYSDATRRTATSKAN